MSTAKIEFKPKDTDIIISCPNCKVCSIVLSAEEYALVEAGQQLVEVCQVCGKNVYLDRSEKH